PRSDLLTWWPVAALWSADQRDISGWTKDARAPEIRVAPAGPVPASAGGVPSEAGWQPVAASAAASRKGARRRAETVMAGPGPWGTGAPWTVPLWHLHDSCRDGRPRRPALSSSGTAGTAPPGRCRAGA